MFMHPPLAPFIHAPQTRSISTQFVLLCVCLIQTLNGSLSTLNHYPLFHSVSPPPPPFYPQTNSTYHVTVSFVCNSGIRWQPEYWTPALSLPPPSPLHLWPISPPQTNSACHVFSLRFRCHVGAGIPHPSPLPVASLVLPPAATQAASANHQ